MSDIKKGTLGDILLASRIITGDDIVAALDEQKRSGARFGEALVNLGVVTQEDIDWALSNQLDIPYVRLKQDMIDPEAIVLVPAAMARTYNCIPLIRAGGELNVALADPLNRPAIEALEHQTGCSINVSVALLREIREMIEVFYSCDEQDSMGFSSAAFSEKVLESINSDLSGAKLMDYLLIFILQNRLTALSLQPFGDVVVVSGRRGGKANTIGTLAANHYPEFSLRLRKAAGIAQSVRPAARGKLAISYRSQPVTFQIATLQGLGGDYFTIRLQVHAHIPNRLVELHLPATQETAFSGLVRADRGITFFASRNTEERDRFMDLMLEEADTSGKNVIILGEGPGRMQKRFPRIPLPESETERARLIMDALDHDPDILVIEDITEGMPFTAACRVAMRGKLVLAGLELRGTRTVLRHLLLYQQKNYFLPFFVNGLVSFKGIQILCPACRTEYTPPREELTAMHLDHVPAAFYHATGCPECSYSGFSTRRFLLDVLTFDDEFLKVFEQTDDVAALDTYLRLIGYHGIEEEGLALLNGGEVSPEEYIASVVL